MLRHLMTLLLSTLLPVALHAAASGEAPAPAADGCKDCASCAKPAPAPAATACKACEECGLGAVPVTMQPPGAEHQALAKLAGSWTVAGSVFMVPGQPPVASTATATVTVLDGGRHTRMDYRGEMRGQPFVGMAIDGFDRVQQKYTSIWVDSMTDQTMLMTGTADANGVITYIGESHCPMAGKNCTFKSVLTPKDADHFTFEMYKDEALGMRLEYSRAQ